MEDIHSSRDTVHISDCGHLMHSNCYKTYLKKGHYKCPVCGVSLYDMEEAWKLASIVHVVLAEVSLDISTEDQSR